ncbi:MAG: hypothetical protein IH956_05880, partial [Chloroflexi bacterium]|nr:hypothetical protein [Chloroflexota bacterium]
MAEQDEVRIGDGPIRFSYAYRDLLSDQGVGINAWADVDGTVAASVGGDGSDGARLWGPRAGRASD